MKLDRPKHFPADQGDALICELFRLARELEALANEQTEHLDFDTYAALCESETKLLAFGNLLSSTNPAELVREELDAVANFLEDLRKQVTSIG